MSRLDSIGPSHGASETAGPRQDKHRRQDRESSHSSEESAAYAQPRRPDADPPEDAQLTAQTLNADGTPKRPMNAFMIFARRRRPQVSAANQTMRTGEISKLLSKEWNSMDTADKQFYLDQAKRLKENFNSKYPDYVYRRRPNNSRKKRRSDATPNPLLDPSASGDAAEDFPGIQDLDYPPTLDGEEPLAPSARDLPPPRGVHHPGVASGYDENTAELSSSQQYTYSTTASDFHSHQNQYTSGARVPPHFPSIHDRAGSDASSLSSLSSHHPFGDADLHAHQHAYPAHSHPQMQSGLYPSENTGTGQGLWNNASGVVRSEHARNTPAGWPMIPPPGLSGLRERSTSALLSKSELFSPPPHRPWSSASAAPPAQYPLQTLAAPYFAPHPASPGAYQSSASSSSTPSASPENYFAAPSHVPAGASYGGRAAGYAQPPALYPPPPPAALAPGTGSYMSSTRGHDDPSRVSAHLRTLPAMHAHPLHGGVPALSASSSGGGGHSSAHMSYWERSQAKLDSGQ